MLSTPSSTIAATSNTSNVASEKVKQSKAEELNDFLTSLDGYKPTVPEALTSFYLERGGVEIKDNRIVKLVALATDKFLADVLNEAKQMSKLRQQAVKNPKRRQEMSDSLEVEDIAGSLSELRVFFRRKKGRVE